MDSDEDRAEWAESTARAAIRPAIGLPLFAALFAAAFVAKRTFDADWGCLLLVALLFVFPYYLMQLSIRLHLRQLRRRHGPHFRYVPGNLRIGAGLYVGFWILTTWICMSIDRLTKP